MKKFADWVEKIQCAFTGILFTLFLILIIVQILTRYVSFIKITWTEEIATYLFVWSVLMGAAVELKRNEHFAFDVLRAKLTGTAKTVLETVINVLLILFSIYLTYCGVMLTRQFWNWTLTSLPEISQRYIWSSLIVCGGTMTLYSLNNFFDQFGFGGKGEDK